MAVNFTDFTTGGTLASDHYLVGYDVNASGGEKKWKYDTLMRAVSSSMTPEIVNKSAINVVDSDTINLDWNASTRTLSATTTSTFSFRNKIINGSFDIWQRGTSFTIPTPNSSLYSADRWWLFSGLNTVASCNRIALTYSELPNFTSCSRVQRVISNTGTNTIAYGQIFETVHTRPLVGKQFTVSFYARKGANFSANSNNLQINIQTGTGIDQNLTNLLTQTWTNWSNTLLQTVPLTTAFQKFSATFTLPTTVTQLALVFLYQGTGTAGAADYFDIAGVQLEEGSVATPFEYRPIGTELALCQRYYFSLASISGSRWDGAGGYSDFTIVYPVSMISIPTVTATFGTGNSVLTILYNSIIFRATTGNHISVQNVNFSAEL